MLFSKYCLYDFVLTCRHFKSIHRLHSFVDWKLLHLIIKEGMCYHHHLSIQNVRLDPTLNKMWKHTALGQLSRTKQYRCTVKIHIKITVNENLATVRLSCVHGPFLFLDFISIKGMEDPGLMEKTSNSVFKWPCIIVTNI